MALRRTTLVLTSLVAVLLATVPAGHAADSPLDVAARRVLATATAGVPLEVVTTTRSADGPRIATERASSTADALGLVKAALARPSTVGVDLAHRVEATATSDDTFRSRQYALDRFGAERVWRTSTGRGVVIAVLDTGVQRDHPDLDGRVLRGYDVLRSRASAPDLNGHGTHVAGIAAAVAGNGRGIAGLAHSARILPVRVLGADGGGSTADVARGIVWAVNNGADVINLSLGSSQADTATREAVAYAVRKDVVVVAAAGNDGCAFLFGAPTAYPAAYPGVVGVGAVTRTAAAASYSSCGSWVDVAAPGSEIISTMVLAPDASLGCTAGRRYCTLSGTSMATPYVAAAAALLRSRAPSLRALTVASLLRSTADDVGPAGVDDRTGAGIVNPRRLLAGR